MSVAMSRRLRERFCKDNGIKIRIFEEPYFTDRLNLYARALEDEIDILGKWSEFINYANQFETEQAYFDEYGRVKDEAIAAIKGSDAFERFNSIDFNKLGYVYDLPYKELEIYNQIYTDRAFISIDMKKANFTALRCYDPEIFGNAETWEEFISRFTNSTYIQSSKYIRQVILGNCNPKRQINYAKYLMSCLLKNIDLSSLDRATCVKSVKTDEIIIDITDSNIGMQDSYVVIKDKVDKAVAQVNLNLHVKVELFTLTALPEGGFIRNYFDGEDHKQYKCLNPYFAPKAFRDALGEELTESDKVFEFEGRLAKFL